MAAKYTQRPKCAYCGKPLPFTGLATAYPQHASVYPSDFGYQGNGVFCTLRHGFQYGLLAVAASAAAAINQGPGGDQ